jgi:hypothetical protein
VKASTVKTSPVKTSTVKAASGHREAFRGLGPPKGFTMTASSP